MSSDKEATDYIELRPGDKVQVWDQWRDQFGQWHFYTHAGSAGGFVNSGVKARRPIPATHQATYEEVPGSRTTQETIINPQRERIAYEELQVGDVIQPGDEWQNDDGRWHPLVLMAGACTQVRDSLRARRPHSITALEKYRGDLIDDIQHVIGERDEARAERDKLKGLIDDLLDEPTAKQVQHMLRTWATELDWSAGCFDSVAREQIDTIQKTLVAVIERIEGMINPEGGTDDN